MKKAFLSMIRFYQKKISPLFPPRCRFYPTCSQYAVEAIERFGACKGGALALWSFCGVIRFFRVDMILCLLKNKYFPS